MPIEVMTKVYVILDHPSYTSEQEMKLNSLPLQSVAFKEVWYFHLERIFLLVLLFDLLGYLPY